MFRELLCKAEEERIEVTYLPLQGKTKGLYCDGVIAINKKLSTTAEKTCILAEELGHYYTSYGNIINQEIISNRKQELRAKRWAVRYLVPFSSIVRAFEAGCKNCSEAADYIGVTEEFLRYAFKAYNNIYRKYKEFGRYVVYLDPPGVYKST
jgi:Zn-dependent peptidase ImmA (M78 family)